MNTIIKKSLQSLLLVPVFALGVSMVMPSITTYAADENADTNFNNGLQGGINAATTDSNNKTASAGSVVSQVVNILMFIIGAVSVIMIIWGGFKYVTSGGDSSGVTAAKNTILYAVIGLIVAVLSLVIVNFVLNDFLDGIS